jgi:hypothetical protein
MSLGLRFKLVVACLALRRASQVIYGGEVARLCRTMRLPKNNQIAPEHSQCCLHDFACTNGVRLPFTLTADAPDQSPASAEMLLAALAAAAPAQPDIAPAQPDIAPAQPDIAPAQPDIAPAQPDIAPAQPD